MIMKKPVVSILMTIYNHENYLHASIKSIINQSYKKWELVAIDNGSRDKSKVILKKFKDKRIKKRFLKKNIGRTNCLNYGLNLCKGKYIAVLDSDDIAKKNRLDIQTKLLEKEPNTWMVASNYNLINTEKKFIKSVNNSDIFLKNPRTLLYQNIIAHSTVMYRKKLINIIGKYPKKFLYAQDYAFYLRVFKKFKIRTLKAKLVNIREPHKNSETLRRSNSRLITIEEIKLLMWSYNNFNLFIKEKIYLIFVVFKKIFKLI